GPSVSEEGNHRSKSEKSNRGETRCRKPPLLIAFGKLEQNRHRRLKQTQCLGERGRTLHVPKQHRALFAVEHRMARSNPFLPLREGPCRRRFIRALFRPPTRTRRSPVDSSSATAPPPTCAWHGRRTRMPWATSSRDSRPNRGAGVSFPWRSPGRS